MCVCGGGGGGAYMRGLIRGVTQVLRKRWAYLRGSVLGGGGGLIGGEIRYALESQPLSSRYFGIFDNRGQLIIEQS